MNQLTSGTGFLRLAQPLCRLPSLPRSKQPWFTGSSKHRRGYRAHLVNRQRPDLLAVQATKSQPDKQQETKDCQTDADAGGGGGDRGASNRKKTSDDDNSKPTQAAFHLVLLHREVFAIVVGVLSLLLTVATVSANQPQHFVQRICETAIKVAKAPNGSGGELVTQSALEKAVAPLATQSSVALLSMSLDHKLSTLDHKLSHKLSHLDNKINCGLWFCSLGLGGLGLGIVAILFKLK